jgi:uncharacterized peroxidase-related enzyme
MSKKNRNSKVLDNPTKISTKKEKATVVDNPTQATTEQEKTKETAKTSWLTVPDESTLPPEVRAIFKQQQDSIGFVHPFVQGYALNPKHLLLWYNYYNQLMYGEGELSPKEREIIAIVSSAANHCDSCVTTHKAHLREVIKDPIFPDRLALNPDDVDLTQRERALVDFAIKINQNASNLSPQDLELLRQAGLSDEAILLAGEIAAQFSLSNKLTKAFGWKVGFEYDRLYR